MLGFNAQRASLLRSRLGLLWPPLSLGFIILLYGLLFSGIFDTPMAQYIPYLASGWVGWRLISGLFSQLGIVFETNKMLIGNLNFPIPMYVFARIYQLTIEFFLHSLVMVAVFIAFQTAPPLTIFMLPIVLLLYTLCGCGIAFSLGFMTARINDLKNLLPPLTQSLFLATPIIWHADKAAGMRRVIVDYNPFYHALEIFRNILGITPFHPTSWIVMGAMAILGIVITLLGYSHFSRRIRMWVA